MLGAAHGRCRGRPHSLCSGGIASTNGVVCAGQTHGEQYAPPVANQMALATALGPIGSVSATDP